MILLRSPGSVLPHYVRALEEAGIPWSDDGGEDFLDSTEVRVALSILRIVDNPRRTSPLSPPCAPRCMASPPTSWLCCARTAPGTSTPPWSGRPTGETGPAGSFWSSLEELRFGAGDRTCRQLIWHVYERTNLLGIFGAMEGGRGAARPTCWPCTPWPASWRRAAAAPCSSSSCGLTAWRRRGGRLPAPSAGGQGGGGLHSVHPRVQGAGEAGGAGVRPHPAAEPGRPDAPRPVPPRPGGWDLGGWIRSGWWSTTRWPGGAVKRQLEREMMAEELRLLYVAMTPGPGEADPHPGSARGTGCSEPAGGGAVSSPLPDGAGAAAERGGLGAPPRPHPAGGRPPAGAGRLPDVEAADLGPAWNIRWVEGQPLALPPEEESEPLHRPLPGAGAGRAGGRTGRRPGVGVLPTGPPRPCRPSSPLPS